MKDKFCEKREIIMCPGHSRPVVDISYSSIVDDSFWIISACKDGKPMIRNGQTGDWVGTFEGHKGAVWTARLDSTATKAATGSADFTAKIWNAVSGEELTTFQHKHIVRALEFSKDDKSLITGGHEKVIKLFDLEKPDSAPQIFSPQTETPVKVLLWLNDPNLILSASQDTNLILWDKRTLNSVKTIPCPSDPNSSVTSIELSKFSNGKYLTITSGNTVSFWDSESLEVIKQFKFPTSLESASLSPDGEKFVTGGEDFYVRLYDYTDATIELDCQKGHHGPVHTVCWSPDGNSYASGSEDGTIRIYVSNQQ